MKPGKPWMILAAVALAAALRLTAALGMGQNPLLLHPVLEDLEYRTQAVRLHMGADLERGISRGSLLYPYLAGMVPGVRGGGTRPLALAQCACEIATVLLLAWLVRRRWGNGAAALAALLYGLDPLGAFFAARFSPVAPATLAFIAAVSVWDRERESETSSLSLGLGFSLLTAVGFLLMPLPFVALLLVRLRDRLRLVRPGGGHRAWGAALLPLVFTLGAAGGLLAYHARLPGGGWVLSWGAGPAIDRAFDPATAGTPRYLRPPSWFSDDELRHQAGEELGRPGTDIDVCRTAAARGWKRVIENPLGTVGVMFSKAAVTLGAWPVPDALSASFLARRSARPFVWLSWSFALVVALGAAGLVLLRHDPLRDTLGQALVAVGIASLLGPASAASRQAALPLLAALGGGWIAGAAGRKADRFRRVPMAALAVTLLVSVAAGLLGPARALRNPSEDLRLLASTFEQTLSWRQAVPVLEEAVRLDPGNLDARVALAEGYLKDALPVASTDALEAAFRTDSTHAGTTAALASRRFLSGRTEEALAMMGRLVERRPRNAAFLRDYGDWLGQVGRMSEAEAALSRAVRLDPTDDAAVKKLQEVVNIRMSLENSLFPDELRSSQDDAYSAALARIADALDRSQWAQADSLLTWAEQTHGQFATTNWMRAGYYARRGNIAASIASLERCQRIAPGRPAVVAQLTRLYVETQQANKVPPLFRESIAAAGADSVVTRQLKALAREIGLPPSLLAP